MLEVGKLYKLTNSHLYMWSEAGQGGGLGGEELQRLLKNDVFMMCEIGRKVGYSHACHIIRGETVGWVWLTSSDCKVLEP